MGVFLGDNVLMGERFWMYCSAVANSVSLYCKGTYMMGVQEAALLMAAEGATVFWVNMCTSRLCFRSNFIKIFFTVFTSFWKFHMDGYWIPGSILCSSAGSFYVLALTEL
jgi:hypothetical protein